MEESGIAHLIAQLIKFINKVMDIFRSKKTRFYNEQRRFDDVMLKKNMQTSIDQLNQLRSSGHDAIQIGQLWKHQVQQIPLEHWEDYQNYWKELSGEVGKHYHAIKSIQGYVGPNLTETYIAVKLIVKAITEREL